MPLTGHDEPPRVRTAGIAALAVLVSVILVFGPTLAVLLSRPAPQDDLPLAIGIALPGMAVMALVGLYLVAKKSATSLRALGCVRPTWRFLHLLWQIPLIVAVAVIAQIVTSLLTGGANVDAGGATQSITMGAPIGIRVVFFVGVALLTPLWEELLFRGFIFTSVRGRWGTVAGVLVSAVLFAAAHGIPILLPYLLVLGISLSFLRELHGNLWAPLALHVTVNSIASAALLAAV